jgi:hypothetical protein
MKRKSIQSNNSGSSTTSSSLKLNNISSTSGNSSGFTKLLPLLSKQTGVSPAVTSAFTTPTDTAKASVNKVRAATPAASSLT